MELSTKELMNQLQNKLIIDLHENEILCPDCKGLRFVLIESNGTKYIETCSNCYTGKLFICNHCRKSNKTNYCSCNEAQRERDYEFHIKQALKDKEHYEKAEKINWKDYVGFYILDDEEHLKTREDLEEWIFERLANEEYIPDYLWAVEGKTHFSIDLRDVISDKCEDGYEDMYDHLDTESALLSQAQEFINQWEKEQCDSLCIFTETYKKAVIIKDLVERIKQCK